MEDVCSDLLVPPPQEEEVQEEVQGEAQEEEQEEEQQEVGQTWTGTGTVKSCTCYCEGGDSATGTPPARTE